MSRRIDIDLLGSQLLGPWGELRQEVRREIASHHYNSTPDLPYKQYRKETLANIKALSNCTFTKVGFPKTIVGGFSDAGGGLAIFEELIFLNASTQIKYGVQFGLFASAIMHLGTQYHHQNFLPDVVSFKVPGCFAMTETGHGSDVANIETTATYDSATKEIIINSPSKKAWKDYIGNAAKDGKAAVVFAQLIVGEENHGVHAIYVPLRNMFGLPLKGIQIEDDGFKGGLNGIDNGRIGFNNVRVPKNNLLDRYGKITETGEYSSPIESKGRRFFTMLGTLVQGRVSLVGAVTNAEKLALTIAIRYAHERKQFESGDTGEFRIIDYPSHKSRLYPRLASVYAQIGMHQSLVDKFHEVFTSESPDEQSVALLETDAAAIKAISTWNALETIQVAREACGGQGFLSENRLVELRKDLDVYATFEGDNHVLLQLVAKRLLQEYATKMKKPELADSLSYMTHKLIRDTHTGTVLGMFKDITNPIKKFSSKKEDSLDSFTRIQLEMSVESLAANFEKSKKAGLTNEEVFLANQNELISLGKKYAQHLQYQGIVKLIQEADTPTHASVLTVLKKIFIISLVKADALSYLSKGILGVNGLDTLAEMEPELLQELAAYDMELIEAFMIEDMLVRAPIGLGAEAQRNLLV
jgi:acyl-CoA oxidase